MNYLIFWTTFILLLSVILWLTIKYDLLKDQSIAPRKPYSYARVQLTFWTFIVLTAFISVTWITGTIPTLDKSTLILLGISAVTTASARMIDISDDTQAARSLAAGVPLQLNRNFSGEDLILDILSDKNGVSIHRLQAALFNLVIGIWFFTKVYLNIKGLDIHTTVADINRVMPVIEENNLVMLGLSSATYAALKATENKS